MQALNIALQPELNLTSPPPYFPTRKVIAAETSQPARQGRQGSQGSQGKPMRGVACFNP